MDRDEVIHGRACEVASEVRQLMHHAGLRIVSMTSQHFHLESGRSGTAARAAKRCLSSLAQHRPTLGPQIIVVAERAL